MISLFRMLQSIVSRDLAHCEPQKYCCCWAKSPGTCSSASLEEANLLSNRKKKVLPSVSPPFRPHLIHAFKMSIWKPVRAKWFLMHEKVLPKNFWAKYDIKKEEIGAHVSWFFLASIVSIVWKTPYQLLQAPRSQRVWNVFFSGPGGLRDLLLCITRGHLSNRKRDILPSLVTLFSLNRC